MKHVLFVCTHNAGRSQIAEAFFNRLAPADLLEYRLDAIRADRTPISCGWRGCCRA